MAGDWLRNFAIALSAAFLPAALYLVSKVWRRLFFYLFDVSRRLLGLDRPACELPIRRKVPLRGDAEE